MSHINKASETQARAVLIALCEQDDRIRTKASNLLSNLEGFEATKLNHPGNHKLDEEEKVHLCVQCDQAFTESTNGAKKCRFHDGWLAPDYRSDAWADHDERCHGTINTAEMREEYSEGFEWDCCDEIGTSVGCRKGYHRSRQDPVGRRDSSQSSSEEDEEDDESDESGM